MIEPQVSLPMANGTSPAPTADPGPLEEPPDQRPVSQGFSPAPVKLASDCLYPSPPAISTIASFAASTAPASLSLTITVASASMTRSFMGAAPQLVGMPRVASRSLAP